MGRTGLALAALGSSYAVAVAGLGGKGLLGNKGGARYTTVVTRPAVATPVFHFRDAMPVHYPTRPSRPEYPTILPTTDPFYGERAAVSGDIVGVAPQVRPPLETEGRDPVAVPYSGASSALGESLGLGPLPGYGLNGGLSGVTQLDLAGFPRFEPDGYIVHDQRGRDRSTCPPSGCPPAGEMSTEAKIMYDKYKRYYRAYGPSARPAPPPGRLVDPVPIGAYSRLPSASTRSGGHFTAQPTVDGRARLGGGFTGSSRPPLAAAFGGGPASFPGLDGVDGYRASRLQDDRIALGGGGRDSFFGKIYDAPEPSAHQVHNLPQAYGGDVYSADSNSVHGSRAAGRASIG